MALTFVLVILDVRAACGQTFDIRKRDMRGHHDVVRALQHEHWTAHSVEVGAEWRGSREPLRVVAFEAVRHATERDRIRHGIDDHARADHIAVRGEQPERGEASGRPSHRDHMIERAE